MVSERVDPEAIFGSLLPHSRARSLPPLPQQRLKSGRISGVFVQGGQAFPMSKYIKIKSLGQAPEDVSQLFPCSQPPTLSFHRAKFSSVLGTQLANYLHAHPLPETCLVWPRYVT